MRESKHKTAGKGRCAEEHDKATLLSPCPSAHRMHPGLTRSCCTTRRAVGGVQ